MTKTEILDAINLLLVSKWPDRTVYVDVCPVDFNRPSFWLTVEKYDLTDGNRFLIRHDLQIRLTLYDELDEHYDASWYRLSQETDAVTELLIRGWMVGRRHLKPLLKVLPIAVLVVCCVIGMIYSGGFFSGTDFVSAFSNSDASVGLMFGSAFGLLFALIYYTVRRSMSFKEMMSCVPEGFKAMVPAILILTFAWSLKSMTDSLGAKYFVRDFVYNNAESLQNFLPAIVFLIGCGLAFATGTSWGTFGILIPIVQNVFPLDNPLGIICISACMAGAVCGDHCSPISDTTIMASAGAQCDHVNHVSTQLPYAISCAVISFVTYIVAGFVQTPFIALPVGIVLMLAFLFIMKQLSPGQSHRAA